MDPAPPSPLTFTLTLTLTPTLTQARVHPWIRLNRVVRDIPSQYILGGLDNPNLRQIVLADMARRGNATS